MAPETSRNLSLKDKLGIVWLLCRVLGAAALDLLALPIQKLLRRETTIKSIVLAGLRKYLSGLSVVQEQYLSPSTTRAYLQLSTRTRFEPRFVHNGRGLWIGDARAKKVVLYVHGGGFVNPASAMHMDWLHALAQGLSTQRRPVAVVALAYTLAPEAQYPAQLREAVALLDHLMDAQGLTSTDIVLAGDSAGGNVVLGMLSHMLHPHPQIQPLEPQGARVAGALLISPWCDFSVARLSTVANAPLDFLTPVALKRWSDAFMGNAMPDPYNQALLAPEQWWGGLHEIVAGGVLLWGGGGEVLIDGILAMGERLAKEAGETKVRLEIVPGACHEEMIMKPVLGGSGKAESQSVIEQWLEDALGTAA